MTTEQQDSQRDDGALLYASVQPSGEKEHEYVYSLLTGFIDEEAYPTSPYVPRLIANSPADNANVLSALVSELGTCESFDFAIAFVAESGISVLMQALLDAERRGVRGRILTSTYLGFNSPTALEKLREFANIELRVFEGALHTKGYFFTHDEMRTLVIGSSNLTQHALLENQEWNLLVHSFERGSVCRSTQHEFEELWNASQTHVVDEEWLASYRAQYRPPEQAHSYQSSPVSGERRDGRDVRQPIEPNLMQAEALANLEKLRGEGQRRALIVSATGTGKTYLAAFDVRASGAERVLFVTHRERIARDALESFERVNGPEHAYGMYTGGRREADADFVFCTVQSLVLHLDEFACDAFDYIIVDEAHRAGAASYQKIIGHFTPRFLLGMTATPERNDGYNIYDLFDNNIAYRITLQRAQESDMLAPFHYFGIADLFIDDECQDDATMFARLTSEERVKHVMRQIDAYSVCEERRGLIFCSRVAEAFELARMFRERGMRCVAIDGSSSDDERNEAIERLECDRGTRDDWIEYILTVDIFNEGIDIPCLNQIIMLRPTESAIIFVQQLGRGLRKCDGKEYVLVLDFIGNYQKNFLIPVALSGDRSYNKDNLRRYVQEGSRIIKGCSTVSFDHVSEQRIYQALDVQKFGNVKLIRQEYLALKNMLGRVPTLMDFHTCESIDPQLIFNNSKLGSYHEFLKKYEKDDYRVSFTAEQEKMLLFVSRKLANGKRPQELLLLRELLDSGRVPQQRYASIVREVSQQLPLSTESVARMLGGGFISSALAASFGTRDFARLEDGCFVIGIELARALQDEMFRVELDDLIEVGLAKFAEGYADTYDHTNFALGAKYTYEDVCRLLNWNENVNAQNIGGYKYDEPTNTFPVFINYEKGEDVAATIRYHDRFQSPSSLIAISKQPRHLDSPEITRLRDFERNGMKSYLFVRKNKDDKESKEFYFLGGIRPTGSFEDIVMEGTDKPAVEIEYVLDRPVPDELFDYLTSGVA